MGNFTPRESEGSEIPIFNLKYPRKWGKIQIEPSSINHYFYTSIATDVKFTTLTHNIKVNLKTSKL